MRITSDERRSVVLCFLIEYLEEHDWSPSFTEIAEGCSMHRRYVRPILDALQEEGRVVAPAGKQRAIQITDKTRRELAALHATKGE